MHPRQSSLLLLQLGKYGLSGALSAAVAWVMALALHHLTSWPYECAQAAGFAAGTAVNFPISRRWAFRSQHADVSRQLLVFVGITCVGFSINEVSLWMAVSRFHLWVTLGMALGLGVASIWNFTMNRWLTFGMLDKCDE